MERTQSSLTAHMLLLESNHSEIFKATRGQDKGKISMAKFRMHIKRHAKKPSKKITQLLYKSHVKT